MSDELRIGDRVEVIDELPELRGSEYWITAIEATTEFGSVARHVVLNYTICGGWPPSRDAGLTDGYAAEDLRRVGDAPRWPDGELMP